MTDPVAAQAVTWLPLLREALAKEGRFRWPLRGNSMWPTLPAECEIELAPLAFPVRPGELIVFVVDDTLIAHRLVRRTGHYWIAQGDHRLAPDRPLRPDQVVGRVIAAYQNNRRCWPRRFSPLWRVAWLTRYQALRAARAARAAWRIGRKAVRHA
jgi:phage repressor protein C with HTH and peptisase S24 domain